MMSIGRVKICTRDVWMTVKVSKEFFPFSKQTFRERILHACFTAYSYLSNISAKSLEIGTMSTLDLQAKLLSVLSPELLNNSVYWVINNGTDLREHLGTDE